MPLTKEGQINVSLAQQKSDQSFIARFGAEKLQDKLDTEGLYAYGFANDEQRNQSRDELFALSEDCLWGSNKELKKYSAYLAHRRWFDFSFWTSNLAEINKVLSVVKPFPKKVFEQRLVASGLIVQEVPVYRLAELSEDEIRSKKGGVLWHSYCYIDLNKSINR